MTTSGDLFIGASRVASKRPVKGINPTTGESFQSTFSGASADEVSRACLLAEAAFDPYRALDPERRAQFLETIADRIEAIGHDLITCAMAETALPRPRLEGERGRTTGQLRLFASRVRDGHWQDVRIDTALPDRKPMPRPDLRMRRIPVGPVAVFGSSNFPLAFSTAGGDTASALAAGCPVVVKAHPAHLGTSELVAIAVSEAVVACGLPEGVFSMLFDDGFDVGQALVRHPAIQAVGFTGSRRGGLALVALAQARPQPIPVYAEMSSVNPVYLLPKALAARGEALATAFVDSLTLGVGQFCTNPGLVLAIQGAAFDAFRSAAETALRTKPCGVMLTPGIATAYKDGVSKLARNPVVQDAARGEAAAGPSRAQAALHVTEASALLADAALMDEVFGPSAVLVSCADADEMLALTSKLEGQLTATLQLDTADHALALRLLPILERKVGRILANGWPTGVEVCDAMVHGGPYPATSDTRTTSVGTAAMERFLRPVCYQSLPADLLPPALQDSNPLALRRLTNGRYS